MSGKSFTQYSEADMKSDLTSNERHKAYFHLSHIISMIVSMILSKLKFAYNNVEVEKMFTGKIISISKGNYECRSVYRYAHYENRQKPVFSLLWVILLMSSFIHLFLK